MITIDKLPMKFSKEVSGRNEVRELIAKAQSGNIRARNKLIEGNIKLAVKCAAKYSHQLPIEDLINEATFALEKAISKFDLSKDIKFSTYAVIWIRQRLQRYFVNNRSLIRLPCHIYEYARPSHPEHRKRYQEVKAALKKSDMFSLDYKFSDDPDAGTLLDILAESDNYVTTTNSQKKKAFDLMDRIINDLSGEEKWIFLCLIDDGMQIKKAIEGFMPRSTFTKKRAALLAKIKRKYKRDFDLIDFD